MLEEDKDPVASIASSPRSLDSIGDIVMPWWNQDSSWTHEKSNHQDHQGHSSSSSQGTNTSKWWSSWWSKSEKEQTPDDRQTCEWYDKSVDKRTGDWYQKPAEERAEQWCHIENGAEAKAEPMAKASTGNAEVEPGAAKRSRTTKSRFWKGQHESLDHQRDCESPRAQTFVADFETSSDEDMTDQPRLEQPVVEPGYILATANQAVNHATLTFLDKKKDNPVIVDITDYEENESDIMDITGNKVNKNVIVNISENQKVNPGVGNTKGTMKKKTDVKGASVRTSSESTAASSGAASSSKRNHEFGFNEKQQKDISAWHYFKPPDDGLPTDPHKEDFWWTRKSSSNGTRPFGEGERACAGSVGVMCAEVLPKKKMCLSFRGEDAQSDPNGGFVKYTCYRCVHCEQVMRCNELKKTCAALGWDDFMSHEQIDKVVGVENVIGLRKEGMPSRTAWKKVSELKKSYTIQLMPIEKFGDITAAYYTQQGVKNTIKQQFTTSSSFVNHTCDAQAQREIRGVGLSASGLSLINESYVTVFYKKRGEGEESENDSTLETIDEGDDDGGDPDAAPMAQASTGNAMVTRKSHELAEGTDFQAVIRGKGKVITRAIGDAFPLLTLDDVERLRSARGKSFRNSAHSFKIKIQDNMDTLHCDKRSCRWCGDSFRSYREELEHREGPRHRQTMKDIGEDDLHCPFCDEVFHVHSYATKEEFRTAFLDHISSPQHQMKSTKVYEKAEMLGPKAMITGAHLCFRLLKVHLMLKRHEFILTITSDLIQSDDPMIKFMSKTLAVAWRRCELMSAITNKIQDLAEKSFELDKEDGTMDNSEVMKRNDEVFWTATEELAKAQEITLGKEFGVKPKSQEQRILQQKLDYEDRLLQNVGLFNMCPHCGLAFPALLWHECTRGTMFIKEDFARNANELASEFLHWQSNAPKIGSRKFGWKCLCEWGYLAKYKEDREELCKREGLDMPESMMKIWNNMVKNFGDDWHKWPLFGCGRGFIAYSAGPSMCMNVQLKHESKSIACMRPPDLIREAFEELKLAELSKVLTKVGFDNLFLIFSLAFPVHDEHQVKYTTWNKEVIDIVGLCRYPLKEWRELDRPFFTIYGWWFFAMVMMMGARDADQATKTLKLLWTARDKGHTDYVLSKSEKKWAVEGPSMPQTLDEFRKQYVNACTGFFVADAEPMAKASTGNADAFDPEKGRTVSSPFEGPMGFGDTVDPVAKQEYERMLKKAQRDISALSVGTKGTSTTSATI